MLYLYVGYARTKVRPFVGTEQIMLLGLADAPTAREACDWALDKAQALYPNCQVAMNVTEPNGDMIAVAVQ